MLFKVAKIDSMVWWIEIDFTQVEQTKHNLLTQVTVIIKMSNQTALNCPI